MGTSCGELLKAVALLFFSIILPESFAFLSRLGVHLTRTSMSSMSGPRAFLAYFYLTYLMGFTCSVPIVPPIVNSLSLIQEMSNPAVKRESLPLRLAQYNSTSTTSKSANVSALGLMTVDNSDNSDDFPIPHTHLSLRFGNLGSYLHPFDLENLLIAIRAEIEAEINAHGRLARLPSTEYSKNLAGLQFWIQVLPWDMVNLTWTELAVVVEGLWLYIVDGRHDRETFIDVINNVIGRQVAFGWIGKPHRPIDHTSSTAAIRRGLKIRSPSHS